jgi:hypothetical protein
MVVDLPKILKEVRIGTIITAIGVGIAYYLFGYTMLAPKYNWDVATVGWGAMIGGILLTALGILILLYYVLLKKP